MPAQFRQASQMLGLKLSQVLNGEARKRLSVRRRDMTINLQPRPTSQRSNLLSGHYRLPRLIGSFDITITRDTETSYDPKYKDTRK